MSYILLLNYYCKTKLDDLNLIRIKNNLIYFFICLDNEA